MWWGILRIFRDENEVGCLFQRFQRMLKISASKIAGSSGTEVDAYGPAW